jgi:glycosyltransferase involved in cell wall biosynthesis
MDLHNTSKSKKILVLAPFRIWPPHFGASERVYNLIKQLAQTGEYAISVLYTDYAQIKDAGLSVEKIKYVTAKGIGPQRRWAQALNPRLIREGVHLIRSRDPDVILADHLWSIPNALALHFLTRVPYILDEHNAEFVRFRRMKKRGTPIVRILEKVGCQFAQKVLCVSHADRKHLVDLGVVDEKITVVPNAIDVQKYRPDLTARARIRKTLSVKENQPVLLFFGKLDYTPNLEAVEVLVREILPRVVKQRPDAQFVVCGYNPPQDCYRHPNLHFMGVVPRIEDYVNASDIVVVPLLSGGGTKFKIIQSIACGRPVITTSIGAEGIAEAGEWMQVTDDWDVFVDLVLSRLQKRDEGLSKSVLERFRYYYSLESMGHILQTVIVSQI